MYWCFIIVIKVGNFCVGGSGGGGSGGGENMHASGPEEALYNCRRKQRRNRTTFTLQQVIKQF